MAARTRWSRVGIVFRRRLPRGLRSAVLSFRIPEPCHRAFVIDIVAGTLLALGLALLRFSMPVLRKSLGAPEHLVVLLIVIQTGSMVLSPIWAGATHLRRKVPLFVFGAVLSGLLLIVASLSVPLARALFHADALEWTLWGVHADVLAFFVLTSLVFLSASGFNALQVAIYGQNYPARLRARIVSRITIARVGVPLLVVLVAARLLDLWEHAYAPIMALGGLLLLVGGLQYRRMPVAGEEHLPSKINVPELKRRMDPRSVGRLLRENRHFARFQLWQTWHGSGNLICESAFLLVMLDADQLNLDYLQIGLLTQVIPPLMLILSTTLWAPMIDRLPPARARVFNSPFWILGLWLFPLSVIVPGGLPFAYAAFVCRGLAMGGSTLLWALGPLHYARKDEPAHYLAAHNYLTGLRGLVAVSIGGAAYFWIGKWVFLVGGLMMTAAAVGFYLQDRAERRDPEFARQPVRLGGRDAEARAADR